MSNGANALARQRLNHRRKIVGRERTGRRARRAADTTTEPQREPSPPRDPASLVVGAIAAQVVGGLVTQMSPFMIGGLMDGLSLSERDAGFVVSVEILTLAMTAIAIAPILPKFSDRRVGLTAVALTLLAQGASIFIASLPLLTVLRGIAGIGRARFTPCWLRVASRSSNPDKVYGYFQVAWALGSAALFAIGGQAHCRLSKAAYSH